MAYRPPIVGEFSMGAPVPPPMLNRLGETNKKLLEVQRAEFARLKEDPTLIKEIREKYHPRGTCKIHGRRYVPHPLAVRCLHPDCVSLILVNCAAKQYRLRQARKIQRLGYWDDFVQYAALNKLNWIRRYPLFPDLFNFRQIVSTFALQVVHVPEIAGQQTEYEITDEYTIRQLIESAADEMTNCDDNILETAAFRQARERLGNDTHLLALGGILTSKDVARIEQPASDKGSQLDYYLAMDSILEAERAWLALQLSDYEVPYAEAAATKEPFRTTVPSSD